MKIKWKWWDFCIHYTGVGLFVSDKTWFSDSRKWSGCLQKFERMQIYHLPYGSSMKHLLNPPLDLELTVCQHDLYFQNWKKDKCWLEK